MEDLAGKEGSILRGEEDIGGCYFMWRPGATHGTLLSKVLYLFSLHASWNERSPYRARCNAVHADGARHQLQRQAPREGHYGALGGGVVEQMRIPLVSIHAGGVDDAAAVRHVLHRVLNKEKHGKNVGSKRALNLLRIHVLYFLHRMLLRCVVHQYINPAESIHHLVDHLPVDRGETPVG